MDQVGARDVEVRADRAAYRRHRRGMLLSLLAFALYLPAVGLILTLIASVLGRAVARLYAGEVFFAGLFVLMAIACFDVRGSFFYRCPRCGRWLSRVIPLDRSESNTHYHCADCRVVWDLGWAWSREGGVGG